jgi:transcriptional regulator with XRE-family HTH domain
MELQNTNQSENLPQDFRQWLQREFMSRCKKNPKYSLRAFANLLNKDSSTLSQILAGKRRVSKKLAEKICDKLNPSPNQRDAVLKNFNLKDGQSQDPPSYQQIMLDAFTIISDWYHYAILELTFTEGFQNNCNWIGRKLNIPAVEVKAAIERLKRLGLLDETKGKLTKTKKFITNYDVGVTSPALKELQREILKMALDSIDNIPQEEKDLTSMTMAIDVSKIDEARRLITKFRRNLCQFLEDGKRTRVYHLGVQLYPVSKATCQEEK